MSTVETNDEGLGRAEEKGYSAPALEKGLDILESLAERESAMSLRELGAMLGRNKNEIFRMIHVLIARGYVQRDSVTDEIGLTNKLFALGLRTPRSRTLLEIAMPEMRKLAEEIDQAPHLVVVYKGRTVIVGTIPTNSDVTFNLHLGYGRLASEAATGRMIMSYQTAETRTAMLADYETRSGQPIDRAAFETMAEAIVERGYILGKSTDFVGITDVCGPVFGRDGHAVASIIIPHVDRVSEKPDHAAVLEKVLATCARISGRL